MDEPLLDEVLHLALYIAAIGFVGVSAAAVLERVVGTPTPVLRRLHVFVAAAALLVLVAAERAYHLLT